MVVFNDRFYVHRLYEPIMCLSASDLQEQTLQKGAHVFDLAWSGNSYRHLVSPPHSTSMKQKLALFNHNVCKAE